MASERSSLREELLRGSGSMGMPPKQEEEECCDYAEQNREPGGWTALLAGTALQIGGTPAVRHPWVHVDSFGTASLVEVDKHRLVGDLSVRYRDLLTLDPTVPIPFPAAILIREKALVVNLETVRMIICSNQCYTLSVPKASDPRVATYPTLDNPFVRQLCKCLRTGKSTGTLHDLSRNSNAFDFDAPFELRALEVALATTTNIIDREVFDLEKEAYPTIDRLAADISRGVLEDVRRVKHTMGKLTARAQRIKSELEEILDDDADMQDMYLARRAMMLGEDAPPERVGMVATPAGSVADGSTHHLYRRSAMGGGKAHSEAELRYGAASARGPASTQGSPRGLPHPPSDSSLLQHSLATARHHTYQFDGSSVGAEAAELAGAQLAQHAQQHAQLDGDGDRAAGQPAAERLGVHTRSHADLAGQGEGSVRHGVRHGGNASGRQGGWQRAGTLVRTVRTLKKRSKHKDGPPASPAGGAPAAAHGSLGATPSVAIGGAGQAGGLLYTADSAPPDICVEHLPSRAASDEDDDEVIEETFIEGPSAPAVDPHEIEDAEDLLETYYLQVDYLLRRLLSISERIDDTEDLVAIKMDHRRNELVATDLMVTTGAAGFAWVAMIAGLFGMNLSSGWEASYGVFWAVFGCAMAGGVLIVGLIIAWVRHRRLMFIPSSI